MNDYLEKIQELQEDQDLIMTNLNKRQTSTILMDFYRENPV